MSGVDGVPVITRYIRCRKVRYAVREVVSAAADERAFCRGRWQFDGDKLNTLHHLGAGTFVEWENGEGAGLIGLPIPGRG